MKVFAIGSLDQPLTPELRQKIMPREVPDTLKLYLDGVIEQFWYRTDQPGVIFLMNVASVEEAKSKIAALPLAAGGHVRFDFLQVGPLAPLALLLQGR